MQDLSVPLPPLGEAEEAIVGDPAASARQAIRAAQASADAALHAQFEDAEKGGDSTAFDYTASVDASRGITLAPVPENSDGAPAGEAPGVAAEAANVLAYLGRMQRGGQIQSFGCTLLLEEPSFAILAFSENASQLLGLLPSPKDKDTDKDQASASPGAAHGSNGGTGPLSSSAEHRKKRTLGSAFRSLSIKIHHAIAGHRTKMGAGAPHDARNGAGKAEREVASAPQSPGGNQSSNGGGNALERTGSGSKSVWSPFRRSGSRDGSPPSSAPCTASSSPLLSPRGKDAAVAPAPKEPFKPVKLDFGVCALDMFSADSAATLKKVTAANDVTMMNPLLVQSVGNGEAESERSFYAIFHRSEEGLLMDLEPIRPEDHVFTGEGALQAHRLAAKAIARLERVPVGNLRGLCDVVVQEVRELTGYDRIMAYKFHEDEHGEVLAEACREDMEPYLGLHYPATDIPQAARFLFMKNRVRIIVDVETSNVKILQDSKKVQKPITLSNSTLRAVHGCHIQYMKNMGTKGSIGMAIVVNDPDASQAPRTPGRDQAKKLWGLVVCHHESARYLPYPIRLACEFLMQVLSLKVNMETEMAQQEKEKQMLKTQTLLCDMLQRNAPVGIMTQYPNIMDLVKSDGAALFYGGKFWTLGATPTHRQMQDIVLWLQSEHGTSSGFSTDSLKDSGYPEADTLGDGVCGMIAAQLIGNDYLFWFRGHVEKEVVWHGAKHQKGEKDDGRRMNPRSSFQAFLEVVRHRSAPWDDIEIDAVSSLVLILRGHLTAFTATDLRDMESARLSNHEVERMSIAESELSRMLETATAPVFTVDKQGCVTAWNSKMGEITGLNPGDALGMSLAMDLADNKDAVAAAVDAALRGEEAKNIEVRLRKFAPKYRSGSSGSARSLPDPCPSPSARPGSALGSSASLAPGGTVVLLMNAFVSRGGLLEDYEEGEEEEGKAAQGKGKGKGKGAVSGVCFTGQDLTAQRMVEGHFTKVQGDYAAIVHSGNSLIPPIFAINETGHCAEWNPAMETLSGLQREEALGQMLLGGVFGALLRMKPVDKTKLTIVLNKGVTGHNTERYPLIFLNRQGELVEALLTVSSRRDAEGGVMGAFCFLHTASAELQQALKLQSAAQEFAEGKAKTVAYMRQEIKAPLDGVKWLRAKMQSWQLPDPQRKVLETSVRCEQQLARVLGDDAVENLEEGFLGMERDEFQLAPVVEAVVSMARQACARTGVDFACECTEDISTKPPLCGDAMRLQQALSDFIGTAAQFTPPGGWLQLRVITGSRALFMDSNSLRCEFRIMHSGSEGLPRPMVDQMLDTLAYKAQMTQEGLGLSVSRRIVQAMDGEVQYDRAGDHWQFKIRMSLPYPRDASSCATPTHQGSGHFDAIDEKIEILAAS